MNERACDSDSKIGVVFALGLGVITTCSEHADPFADHAGKAATLQSLIKQIGGGSDANDGDSPAQRTAEAGKGSVNAASNTGTTAGASTSSSQQQVNVAGEHDTPAKEMMEKAYGLFRAASGGLSLV